MTVAVFITSESDAACLIPWGVHFAIVDHTDLLIVCPKKSKGKRAWEKLEVSDKDSRALYQSVFSELNKLDPNRVVMKEAIADGGESSDMDRVAIETRELVAAAPEDAFVEEVGNLDVRLVLLPAFAPVKGSSETDMNWHQKVFRAAPCQVAVVKGNLPTGEASSRILVASEGETDPDQKLAVLRSLQLAKSVEADKVSLLYVRPDDDEVAPQIAEQHLQQLVKTKQDKSLEIVPRSILADSLCDGLRQIPGSEFDVLLVGTRKEKVIRSLFLDLDLGTEESDPAILVVRAAVPLTVRVWGGVTVWVRSKVPQIDRERRVKLVDDLQVNSQFNFDFGALISLSTLIASLGLVRNSGAVVIGAMLVAPLMTPLVAVGFALVQGNLKLIRSALKSVVLGFAVALLIGVLIGLMLRLFAPGLEISGQMYERGSPNFLDLVVALASGVAAAYAMGRPNLISALPGVAIAAALVPPVATSGLALTMGDLTLAGGASLLFFTNIIAIVLGTAITFWCVGIRTRISEGRSTQIWPRYCLIGFVILSVLLTLEMWNFNPLAEPYGGGSK
jgi:uncharacterized hydrophobic protein (TIGR00271 family)